MTRDEFDEQESIDTVRDIAAFVGCFGVGAALIGLGIGLFVWAVLG